MINLETLEPNTQAQYVEDGGVADCTVLAVDRTRPDIWTFRVRFDKILQQPSLGPDWKAGEEFNPAINPEYRNGGVPGMWHLFGAGEYA